MLKYILPLAICVSALPAQTVYVSRMWHNHQPLYWPEWNGNGSQTNRVQYAWDSIVLKPGQTYGTGVGHPDNNLTDIFGLDDRRNAYQSGPKDSLASCPSSAGFCMSYSGSLIDNIRSLGGANQLGYGSGWWDGNRTAKNWTTPSGSRRMDLVGFTYHHSLAPLLPKSVFKKELQIFKQAWWKAWNGNSNLSDHSKGYFPTEMAFSESMIDVLAAEGYEWSIVPSHHLSRTCPTYMNQFSLPTTYGIYSSPPNKADLLGPSPTSGWWYSEPNPGNAAWNVAPFAYQLHRAKYINPNNGNESSMILVPSDDVLSYRFGYANEGINKIQSNIAPYSTDSSRPSIVMPATDGDNAWGGGSSSWFEATPQYFNSAQSAGYQPTAIQDMVNSKAPPANTYVHIEDGAWIFPESDYGSPYFLKWIEPAVGTPGAANTYPNTKVDLETPGFALKFWSWAPIITGANWCETAEQILVSQGGSVAAWKIQAPYDWNGTYNSPNNVELAWHIYLGGLDSGFNYYGGLGNDDEVKQTLATNRAIEKVQSFVTSNLASDLTPPTVLKPQRFPYNPGAYTFGWFNSYTGASNYLKKMGSDFYIWTHAYDVSGIQSMNVKVRVDNDGTNSMSSNHNETFAGGSEVGTWVTIPMTMRSLPSTQAALNAAANNGQINYFVTPTHLADYYFTKVTNTNLPNFRNKLLDYYIESTDNKGNVSKSDIQHVFVEDDGNTPPPPGPVVTTDPAAPTDCGTMTITYNPSGRALSAASPVYIHIGTNGWTNVTSPRPAMTLSGSTWTYTYTVPTGATVVDFVFTNGATTDATIWDNNSGADWHVSVTACNTNPPAVPVNLAATATSSSSISLNWDDVPNATSYIIYQNGTQVGTSTASDAVSSGLTPSTSYTFTIAAVNANGSSAQSTSASATTFTPPPTIIPFTMDGTADSPGYLVSNPGMTIYAAVRGTQLYVATWSPGAAAGNDHFILIGDTTLSTPTTAVPWAKTGTTAQPLNQPYIAAESTNTFAGWFNNNSADTTIARGAEGSQIEGTIDLQNAFGSMPTQVCLTALAYQTADAGILGAQAPASVVANGDVENSEFLCLPIEAIRDEDSNGVFDIFEPCGFRVKNLTKTGNSLTLTWSSFPGRQYKITTSTSLTSGSWSDVAGSTVTAPANVTETSLTIPITPASEPKRFFRVELVP